MTFEIQATLNRQPWCHSSKWCKKRIWLTAVWGKTV